MEVIGLRRNIKRRLKSRLDQAAQDFLRLDRTGVDFTKPPGAPALAPPDSVSWRVFKNPVSLFIGGVAAVILELAEPRVRTGVWEHTGFRDDPATRLRRTGLAAMMTVYGAAEEAKKLIAQVNEMHRRVEGKTPDGAHYSASDPELLTWVQATAAFGFLEAYHAYVAPFSAEKRDRYYSEGLKSAALYGATGAPATVAELEALFDAFRPQLEASDIILEFLEIMRDAPAFPEPLRRLQRVFVRAAVELVPADIQSVLELEDRGLRPLEEGLVRRLARRADRIALPSSPAVEACRRLGLPEDYLFRRD